MPRSVLICDDHEVVRSGLASMLEGTDWITDEAATPLCAIRKLAKMHFDLISVDVKMEGMNGLDFIAALRDGEYGEEAAKTPIIVMTTFDNPTYMARAHAIGVNAFMLKGDSHARIIEVFQAVADGCSLPQSFQMQRFVGAMVTRIQPNGDIPLTDQETNLLRYLALALSNKEIAQSMNISIETVKECVQHLLLKMQVNDRTQAAVWAVRKGLV